MELDQVVVLHHLKELGYENVESHLLQKFMKDLKKLIKYEKQKTLVEEKRKMNDDLNKKRNLLEDKQDIPPNNNCKSVCCNKKKNEVFERLSRPTLKTKICSKATSAIGIQTDLQNKKTRENKYSQMLKRKQMDPVSLHQYYQTEWQNHKVPGEKNHNDLRWQIRRAMIHK
ncbi:ACYPI006496 protein [Aphis craccivora]|uniref:ACYPI006496 protein n=1 Tax=Aphis craccivora TaxID=307492 RepID=A0A6G0YN06_APHCR|nr:ACYPI006496 protein [Aphis craccivora]